MLYVLASRFQLNGTTRGRREGKCGGGGRGRNTCRTSVDAKIQWKKKGKKIQNKIYKKKRKEKERARKSREHESQKKNKTKQNQKEKKRKEGDKKKEEEEEEQRKPGQKKKSDE